MTINLQLPEKQSLKPTITVFGVGGAGGNAISNMINSNLEGVEFVIANTDAQSLEESQCEKKIQLGETITQGLGAGSYPEVGKASAEESVDEIIDHLDGRNMVFVTAGLGGGTGTGAAPVVARLAREKGILTVAVVTKPFHFEGTHRMRIAELGLQELSKYVDTLIVIPNQNLFRVADKNTTFLDAFKLADDVLHSGVRGITDLMVMPGLINLDFSDVRSVMSEMGKAMMGTGEAEGENRSIDAAEAAIANPLLDNVSMKGARGVLINITGGADMTLFEVDEAANRIREEVDQDANIIFGSTFDNSMEGRVRVSVVATGIEYGSEEQPVTHIYAEPEEEPEKIEAEDDEETIAAASNSVQTIEASEEDGDKEEYNNGFYSDSEEDHDDDDDTFVSPEPVEPPQSFTGAHEEGMKSAFEAREDIADKKRPGGGILGSLFGKKEEDADFLNEEKRSEKGEDEPKRDSHASEKEVIKLEDELDIPAFLRRKSS